jgi:hypothetical protein
MLARTLPLALFRCGYSKIVSINSFRGGFFEEELHLKVRTDMNHIPLEIEGFVRPTFIQDPGKTLHSTEHYTASLFCKLWFSWHNQRTTDGVHHAPG